MPDPLDRQLILWGAGGHSRVVSDAVRSRGTYDVTRLIVDTGYAPSGEAGGSVPVVEIGDPCGWLLTQNVARVFVAIGENGPRLVRVRRLLKEGFQLPVIAHVCSVISKDALTGAGSFIGPGAIVNAGSTVGAGVIVNSSAVVEHDCRIEDGAHLAPGSVLGGGVRIGAGALVGLGACVCPGLTVGEDVVIGAGSVVTGSISAGSVVAGVPARPLRDRQ